MQENKEKIYADGMFFKLPSDTAPEFIKGKLSIKVVDFIKFLNENQNVGGWVNLDLKVAKASGKGFVQLDTWKPTDKQFKPEEPKEVKDVPDNLHVDTEVEYPEEDIKPEDIPF